MRGRERTGWQKYAKKGKRGCLSEEQTALLEELGIEYDGVKWHRDKKAREEETGILCEQEGIRLIRIREYRLCEIEHCDQNYFVTPNNWNELQNVIQNILLDLTGQEADCDLDRDYVQITEVYQNYAKHKWDMVYEILVKRYQQNGTAAIQYQEIDESGINLYNWLCIQRKEFQSGKMTKEHIRKLQNLNISLDPERSVCLNLQNMREFICGNGCRENEKSMRKVL